MKIFKRIAAIIPMLLDKDQSIWNKILVIGAAIYLISPIEFVPDFLLPFGLIDDIILWTCILVVLGDTLDQYVKYGPKKTKRSFVNYKKKFKGKEVIDNADYQVTEETRGEEDEKE